MWLAPIPKVLRPQALGQLDRGNVIGFLITAGNENGLDLVLRNFTELISRGLYEAALFNAYTSTRTNFAHWPLDSLSALFRLADREKLLAAGDPLPGLGPFTVFRGISGRGRYRRIRGLSWTADEGRARWFANRFRYFGEPAVYRAILPREAIYFYTNDRNEREFVVLPARLKPERIGTRRQQA